MGHSTHAWRLIPHTRLRIGQIRTLQVEKGIALNDIVTHVAKITAEIKFPMKTQCELMVQLANIECVANAVLTPCHHLSLL